MHCANWHNVCFFVNQIPNDINLKVHCVANQIVLFVLLNKIYRYKFEKCNEKMEDLPVCPEKFA